MEITSEAKRLTQNKIINRSRLLKKIKVKRIEKQENEKQKHIAINTNIDA